MIRIHHHHDIHLTFKNPLKVAVVEVEVIPPPPEPSGAVAAIVKASFGGGLVVTAKGPKMAYKLPDEMQVALAISFVDANDNPATVDGPVSWSSSDEAVAHVIVEGSDGLNVTLLAQSIGTAQISATADADLGDGVRSLVTLFDVEVIAGEAVAGTIAPTGEPEPIPK